MYTRPFLFVFLSGSLVACGTSELPLELRTDQARVKQGGKLYALNCARCHGAQGEGHKQWRFKAADGNFPPPPLNGTGHTWHHSQKWLVAFVENGSPRGTMPAWKGKLSRDQIQSILAWAQAKWPKHAYNTWLEINRNPP